MWLLLLLARPFGVYVNDLNHFFALALFLVPVGVSFILTSYFIDLLFQKLLKIDLSSNPFVDGISWFLKLFFFVHIVYLLRLLRCDWACFEMLEYLEQWFAFALMMLLTYVPFALYGRAKFFHSLAKVDQVGDDELELKGDGKEQLIVNLEALLLLKSDDNYVDLFVAKKEGVTKKSLRVTLTSLSDQLTTYPQFQRVHRSFVVNLKYTQKRSFNGLVVKKGDWSIQVPLSPSYKDAVNSIVP